MLVFDDERLRETAKAVIAINPYATRDEDSLVEYMKSTARRAFDDGSGGYVTTGGFVLTVFNNTAGEQEIYSSVMSYTVNQHVKGRT